MVSEPDRVAEARLALRAGDKESAFRAITAALQHPHSLEDSRLSGAFQLYAEISKYFADPATAEKLRAAAEGFVDVGALYQAAQALFLQHQFGVAATLLHRAHRLQAGQPAIVAELVANLHALLRYREAQALLASSGLCEGDPLLSYLLGFSALMSGDLAAARAAMPALAALSGPSAAAREALAGMLAPMLCWPNASISAITRSPPGTPSSRAPYSPMSHPTATARPCAAAMPSSRTRPI
jgi:hypothetical protein